MPPKSSVPTTRQAKHNWKDHKTTPKRPLSVPESLKRLFTSLCAQIDGGHFSNAVKTCDKILRLDPKDSDARQTKLFLLLQTEQYSAALSLIDADDDHAHHAYERAYTLYRLSHESEARDVLKSIKEDQDTEDSRGLMHLEAQLAYRDGSYDVAFDLYNQLLDTAEPDSEEHSDILTNLQASQTHLDFINAGFLHALDSLPTSVTSTLETAPPPQLPSATLPTTSDSTIANPSAGLNSRPPKKVRMSRVPAGVIPGVTPAPDPERWLKKSERSTFGQGRRRKGHSGGGATQGASVDSPPIQTAGSGHLPKIGGGKGKKKR